jgi:limonene-1,2-epoxide hydrolase
MSRETETVRQMIEAFNQNDLERIMACFTPDCVYHNMPMAPVKGIDAIRNVLKGFLGMATEVKWTTHQIAQTGNIVLTERTDGFLIGGRWVELPVMGSFELRGGKIAAWRDYFDLAQFSRQLPAAAE